MVFSPFLSVASTARVNETYFLPRAVVLISASLPRRPSSIKCCILIRVIVKSYFSSFVFDANIQVFSKTKKHFSLFFEKVVDFSFPLLDFAIQVPNSVGLGCGEYLVHGVITIKTVELKRHGLVSLSSIVVKHKTLDDFTRFNVCSKASISLDNSAILCLISLSIYLVLFANIQKIPEPFSDSGRIFI